jgi:hypothetical protein
MEQNDKLILGIGAFILLAILTRKMWMKKGAVEETKNKVVDTDQTKTTEVLDKNKSYEGTIRRVPIGQIS